MVLRKAFPEFHVHKSFHNRSCRFISVRINVPRKIRKVSLRIVTFVDFHKIFHSFFFHISFIKIRIWTNANESFIHKFSNFNFFILFYSRTFHNHSWTFHNHSWTFHIYSITFVVIPTYSYSFIWYSYSFIVIFIL